jgi:hypothetical protein
MDHISNPVPATKSESSSFLMGIFFTSSESLMNACFSEKVNCIFDPGIQVRHLQPGSGTTHAPARLTWQRTYDFKIRSVLIDTSTKWIIFV